MRPSALRRAPSTPVGSNPCRARRCCAGPVFAAPFHLAGRQGRATSTGTGATRTRRGSALEGAVELARGRDVAGLRLRHGGGDRGADDACLKPGDVLVRRPRRLSRACASSPRNACTASRCASSRPPPRRSARRWTGARLVWIETPSNPRLDVCDMRAMATAAHAGGRAGGGRQHARHAARPAAARAGRGHLDDERDKTLCGHSDVLLGVVSTRDGELRRGAQALALAVGRRSRGAFEAWLAHRSLATLALRLERSSAGALAVASRAARAGRRGLPPVRSRGRGADDATTAASSASCSRATSAPRRCSRAARLVAEATSFGGVHATAERRERWGTDDVPPGLHPLLGGHRGPGAICVADLLQALEARAARRRAGLSSWEETDGRGSVGGRLAAPEEGWSGALEEGIAGQTIPVHDGRAAEPLSALRYVRSTSVSSAASGGVRSVCR